MKKVEDKKTLISRQSQSVRELIYESLRESILEGVYEAGEQLKERELAVEFDVSTTPVKEALRQLQKEGLVSTIPRKGTFVSENVMISLEEIAWSRAALEGVAVKIAALKRTDEDLQNFSKIIENMKEYTILHDTEKLNEYNTQFHNYILTMSRNTYIESQVKSIRSYDLYIRGEILSYSNEHSKAFKEHFSIFEAIKNQDPDLAESLMREHIMRSARIVVNEKSK